MGRLSGKVAIVTGGASGVGAATIRRFAEEGARVVCADIADEAGERLVAEICHAGSDAAYCHVDVGTLAEVEAMVAFAVERYGGLDVIHNNAYWTGGGYVGEMDPEIWERSLRVMLTGVFYGMRAAIPRMLERGGGSIINTSSVEGLYGGILGSPYNTAQGGMINLTRPVALQYGRKDIPPHCLRPGAG